MLTPTVPLRRGKNRNGVAASMILVTGDAIDIVLCKKAFDNVQLSFEQLADPSAYVQGDAAADSNPWDAKPSRHARQPRRRRRRR